VSSLQFRFHLYVPFNYRVPEGMYILDKCKLNVH